MKFIINHRIKSNKGKFQLNISGHVDNNSHFFTLCTNTYTPPQNFSKNLTLQGFCWPGKGSWRL